MSKLNDEKLDLEDDDYRESEDEDFNPDQVKDDNLSSDEDDKENQGYEAFQGRGGLIKTRAQRRKEALNPTTQTKPESVIGQASVDVDALWGEMNDPKVAANVKPESSTPQTATPVPATSDLKEEYIDVKRTFKFAGEIKTEVKRVLKSSAEGQDFLRQVEEKKKLKSLGRAPVKRKMSLMDEYKMNKTKKINTLEKSRLDWLGFVDKEGIKEDLTKHNKSGYLDKQGFLSSVDQKIDNDIRQQRAKKMQ